MDVASPTEPIERKPRRFLSFYLPDLSMLRRTPVQVTLLATIFDTQSVFLIAAFILLPLLIGIIIGSYRYSEKEAPGGLEVLASFWEET
jgi:hypothetical protein